MQAIISATDASLDADMVAFQAAGLDRAGLYRFTQTSPLPYFPVSGETGSIYWPAPRDLFDTIFVGPSIRLLGGAWSEAFLRNAARMSGGQVRGVSGPLAESNRFAYESTLDWWYTASSEVLVAEILGRSNQQLQHWIRSDDLFLEFLYDGAERIVGGSRKHRLSGAAWWAESSALLLEAEMRRALSAHSYYIGGISYKAPLLARIIKDHLDDRRFSLVDFGGGYGLLAAELALTQPSAVEVVVRDPGTINLIFAEQLYRGFRSRLRNRFYFSLGKADDFEFDRSHSVISFVGSLVYIDRERREPILSRCWEALESGGILVVHENIKNASFKADYEKMFVVEEIDSLLGRFGPIRRYLSTAVREVTKEQAAEKAVFRVVQKP
jgi:SAM-dependent methyltransferase